MKKRTISLALALLMLLNLAAPTISIAEALLNEASSTGVKILEKYEYLHELSEKEEETFIKDFKTDKETFNELKQRSYRIEEALEAIKIKNDHSIGIEAIETLRKTYTNIKELSIILSRIDAFINRNNISREEKSNLIQKLAEGKTLDEIIETYIEENKTEINKIETMAIGDLDEEKYSKAYEAPFTIDKDNESINPNDGSLIYRYPIVNLLGINGLDINLEAIYSERESKLWGIEGSTTFNEKNNRIGIGWSWNLPVIEIDDTYGSTRAIKYLHLGEGSIYKIKKEMKAGESNLEDYPSKDIQINEDRQNFNNGQEYSSYVLTEKDGKKTYFGKDGRLLGVKDRYGNTITFNHTIIEKHPVINQITDTIARTIEITYSGTEVTIKEPRVGQETKLKLGNIYCEYGKSQKRTIENIIDPLGRNTKFNYFGRLIGYSETSKTRLDLEDVQAQLLDILHPTGGKTEYTYEKMKENFGEYGAIERYRIKERQDRDINNKKTYNIESYTYSRDNSTGYPRYNNSRFLPKDFTYQSTIENEEETKITYTFNNEHLKTNETIIDKTNKILRETEYKYNTKINKLPTKIIKREYYGTYNDYSQTEINYEYDTYSNIIEKIDERGNKTKNEYYKENYNLLQKTEKYENGVLKEETNYDLDSLRKDIGRITNKNIVEEEDKSITTNYKYDIYGNIIEKTIMGRSGTTKENYQYFSNAYISKATIADQNNKITSQEEYTYDLATGAPRTHKDGNGNITTYQYDKLGRITKTTNPDKTYQTLEYDDTNNKITITNENNYTTNLIYDVLGNHIETKEEINGKIISSEEKGYNNLSQLEWTKDGNGNITRYQYDKLERIIKVINSDTTERTIKYQDDQRTEIYKDEENNLSYNIYDEVRNIIEQVRYNQEIEEKSYNTYDHNNNLISHTDKNGNTTTYKYDQLGNLLQITNPIGEKTSYEYNHLGQITKIRTAGGSITTKEYDSSGNLIKEIDSLGKTKEMNYDLAGNIIEEIEIKNGLTITKNYRYNTRNQQIEKTDKEGRTTYSYDNTGKITTITDKNGTVTNTYNPEGTIKTISQTDGKTISYKYDNNGNTTETIDHYGEITKNTYDSRNRLKTVTQKGQITEYQYYKNSQTKEIQYPNRTKIQYSYDEVGNLKSLTNIEANGSLIGQYKYTYDKEGNQLTKEENGKISYYTYDKLNRINTVEEDENTTTYQYDENGNIEEKQINHSPKSIHTIKEAEGTKLISNIKSHKTNYIYDKVNKLIRSQEDIENQEISIKITASKTIVNKGEKITLAVEATGNEQISEEALNQVTWKTDKADLQLEKTKGKTITAIYKGEGKETIKVTATLSNTIAEITITPNNQIQTITIKAPNQYLEKGKEVELELIGLNTDGSKIEDTILEKAIWTSTSPNLELKTSLGKVIKVIYKGEKEEQITIKVSLEGKTASIKLTGIRAITDIKEIQITPAITSAKVGEIVELTVTGQLYNGEQISDQILEQTKWTSEHSYQYIILLKERGKTISCQSIVSGDGGVIMRGKYDEYEPPIEKPVEGIEENSQSNTSNLREEDTEISIEKPKIKEEYEGYEEEIKQEDKRDIIPNRDIIIIPEDPTKGPKIAIVKAELQGKTATAEIRTGKQEIDPIWPTDPIYPHTIDIETIKVEDEEIEGEENSQFTIHDSQLSLKISIEGSIEEVEEKQEEYLIKETNQEIVQPMKVGDNTAYYFGKLSIITDYSYDGQGNLIQKRTTEANNKLAPQVISYKYNINNQLIETINNKNQKTTYTYSPTGLRDTKTTEGTTIGYYYDRGNVIIETENGRPKARNLRGHQLISREENNNKAYYLFNGHGDVAKLINEAGAVVANYEYDIYGLEKQAEENIINNPYRYAGEYYDEETGLYYLRARYYDPELGRFISEDTYRGDIIDPLTLNYYIYCMGNPIKYIDPSGYSGELAGNLSKSWEIVVYIGKLVGAGYKLSKDFTPVGIFVAIVEKPSKAGETDKDLKNDRAFQKAISGGGTGDPGKGNNKKDKKEERKLNLKKQESEIWRGLDNVKGMDRKTSGLGKNKEFYEWDHTHNDIEVYNYKGQHLGSMDPLTGKMYKYPVKGRMIKIK